MSSRSWTAEDMRKPETRSKCRSNLLCCGEIYKECQWPSPSPVHAPRADIVIGGAGFAGLALAIALRQGLGDRLP